MCQEVMNDYLLLFTFTLYRKKVTILIHPKKKNTFSTQVSSQFKMKLFINE